MTALSSPVGSTHPCAFFMRVDSFLTPILCRSVYHSSEVIHTSINKRRGSHGCPVSDSHRGVFPAKRRIDRRMSTPVRTKKMDTMQSMAAVLAAGLLVYLLLAMLCPEKFS